MRSYRCLSLLTAGLLAVLFVVGLGGALTRRGEVFPFASWFLFVLVPNHTVDYDVEFRAANGVVLDPPVRFSRSGELTLQPHSIVAQTLIQQLGNALEQGDTRQSRSLRRQIDSLCRPGSLHYDLVKVVYDPVSRYNTGAALDRRVLGSFTAREP